MRGIHRRVRGLQPTACIRLTPDWWPGEISNMTALRGPEIMAKPLRMHAEDDDLKGVLLRAPSAGPEETTPSTHETIRPGSGDDPRDTPFVGSHESLHDTLNVTTAFGNLLHLVATLTAGGPESARFDALLAQLVGRCRNVHEAYAGRLHEPDGRAPGRAQVESRLAGNDEYLGYYALASRAAAGLSSPSLRTHAVSAVARYCMQVPEIGRVVEERFQFPPRRPPGCRLPGAQFRRAIEVAEKNPGLWDEALRRPRADHADLPGWDFLAGGEATIPDPDAIGNIHEASFHLSHRLLRRVRRPGHHRRIARTRFQWAPGVDRRDPRAGRSSRPTCG